MNDKLTTPTPADDPYPPIEHQSDSLRAIADGPESFASRELSLDGMVEQRIPARRTQALEKLASCVAFAH